MFDYISFTQVDGDNIGKELKLFALSTCGFCKRAIAFLDEHEIQYSYAYIDNLGREMKQRVKNEFFEKFNKKMLFPTLMINDVDFLPGFVRLHWEEAVQK